MTNRDIADHTNQVNETSAARLILAKLGITPADLLDGPAEQRAVVTFAEYVPRVAQAVSAGSRQAYSTYWKRVVDIWGARQLTDVSPSEISQLAERAKTTATQRRNTRGGRSAAEHTISALRCIYNHAVADGILTETDNPARRVTKPRRLPSTRRALPNNRLAEINQTAATTGNDPTLDALLIRLHVETACRRGGALALTRADLDENQCLIQLREKGGTVRWQPVSPTLMAHLLGHADGRGGLDSGHQLLRYGSGRPITRRRYDYLWQRLGIHLPWVATQMVTTHWLRHTTLTWVERNFGYAVAHVFAGHSDSGDHRNATATYVRAHIQEVAAAVTALTGEPHPLAPATKFVSLVDPYDRSDEGPADRPLCPEPTAGPGPVCLLV
ncbi:tyrosine-type recombinase/integrase [Kibdelosporangium lantanae]|uniref:Tyrosine-type recombinase/integrase n=1 Tax=Kibdelosporangium lantanae TaxID=1497396 RepID=A0ABW3M3T8_9PSEU